MKTTVGEVVTIDTNSIVDHYSKENDMNLEFNQSYEELRKVEVTAQMTTREHQFDDGPGEVVHELVFRVKLPPGVDIQPHSDFAETIAEDIVASLGQEIDGYLQICADESSDEGTEENSFDEVAP